MPLVTAALALALGARPLVPATDAGSSPPSGQWRWPLTGVPVVARPFEPPPGPWAAGHRGVDLAAVPEAPVLAAGPGVVSFAGYVAGSGVVSVRHADGLRTTYEPVLPAVRAGASVHAGDLLGHLMPGHGDCGPARWCLHWGLLRGATYLDPLTLVRRGPVRLLPLAADDGSAAGSVEAAQGAREPMVGVTPYPETGTPAMSTARDSEAWSDSSGADVAPLPGSEAPATSTSASRGSRTAALDTWLSGGAGLAGLLAWWATRSPLGRRRLGGRRLGGRAATVRGPLRPRGFAGPRPA